MKILVVGGGSMGRRRLRDLTHLNSGGVALFEPIPERCREVSAAFAVPGFTDFEQALATRPDALVVSTPPALHEPYVRRGVRERLHVFAEVPFVLNAEALAEIVAADGGSRVLGISHTIRYWPPFRLVHDLVSDGAVGSPLYLEYSLGNYLPDWHPYEDYRKFYASDAGLGGAGMDMLLHELSPVQWWLGPLTSVHARFSKVSRLKITGPDCHDILLRFARGAVAFLHHDVIERGTLGRHIRIVGEDGTIEWHQNQPAIRLYSGQENRQREISFDQARDWTAAMEASVEVAGLLGKQSVQSGHIPAAAAPSFTYESCYLREMRHFIQAVTGKEPYSMTSIVEELATVRAFHAALKSNEEGREIVVA